MGPPLFQRGLRSSTRRGAVEEISLWLENPPRSPFGKGGRSRFGGLRSSRPPRSGRGDLVLPFVKGELEGISLRLENPPRSPFGKGGGKACRRAAKQYAVPLADSHPFDGAEIDRFPAHLGQARIPLRTLSGRRHRSNMALEHYFVVLVTHKVFYCVINKTL